MQWVSRVVLAGLVVGGVLTANWAAGAAEPGAKLMGKIVYSRKEGDRVMLHIMNADGTGDREIPGLTESMSSFPAWSPDGKRITFTGTNGQDRFTVGVVNADGTGVQTLTTPTSRAGLASWSRDGKQLAFTAGDQEPHIYIGDADANGARQISSPQGAGMCPVWLADGKAVVYTRMNGNNTGKLVRVQADGQGEETLVDPGAGAAISGASALSTDGKRLLYTLHTPGSGKATLHVMDLEGKSDAMLTEFAMGEGMFGGMASPAWAPDGKGYLIPIKTDKGTGLFHVSEDGQTRTRLTPEGVECLTGSWTK